MKHLALLLDRQLAIEPRERLFDHPRLENHADGTPGTGSASSPCWGAPSPSSRRLDHVSPRW